MPQWEGKSRGNLTGYAIFIFVLKNLGLGFAYFILIFVALYFFIFSTKTHTYYYFRRNHEYSVIKAVYSIYLNYYKFGQILLDKIGIMLGADLKFTYNFENENFIKGIDAGGILLSAHVGNWEIAGQLLKRVEKKFNIVMYDAEHEKIKEFLEKNYTNRNFNVIILRNDMTHIFEIDRALRNNELVCMHADRYIRKEDAMKLHFLGKDAFFPKGPFYLASRYDVPVTFVYAMKKSFRHYHFSATEPKNYYGGRDKSDELMEKVMNDYISWLERLVKDYPLQWFNFYRFWEQDAD